MSTERLLVPGPCCVGRNLNTWCADCEAALYGLAIDMGEIVPPSPIPPQRTFSILTIEIPIHHPAGAKASDLAGSLLDGVINSDAWMLYEGQDPGELDGEPGLYVDEVPFSAAIRSATLTEPGVQS